MSTSDLSELIVKTSKNAKTPNKPFFRNGPVGAYGHRNFPTPNSDDEETCLDNFITPRMEEALAHHSLSIHQDEEVTFSVEQLKFFKSQLELGLKLSPLVVDSIFVHSLCTLPAKWSKELKEIIPLLHAQLDKPHATYPAQLLYQSALHGRPLWIEQQREHPPLNVSPDFDQFPQNLEGIKYV